MPLPSSERPGAKESGLAAEIISPGAVHMTDGISYAELVAENQSLRQRLAEYENQTREGAQAPVEDLRASEQKLVENLMRSYFFYMLDSKGNITYASPSIENVLGFSPDEFIARYPDHVSGNPCNDMAKRITARTLKGEQHSPCDVECVNKYGEIRWLEITEVPVTDSAGQTVAVECIARNITERKLATEGLKISIRKLRNSLAGTVQAISMIVETRDPFTAGHQRRVSSIARSIAQEMGLDEHKVDGIRMAGLIHDLGKLSVPAEILSKPRRLNEHEYALIKTHPQAGYDILKEIDFQWPIDQIVLQHHERWNGTGYPRKLKARA
jgi:PAS domain S-box-containing protein